MVVSQGDWEPLDESSLFACLCGDLGSKNEWECDAVSDWMVPGWDKDVEDGNNVASVVGPLAPDEDVAGVSNWGFGTGDTSPRRRDFRLCDCGGVADGGVNSGSAPGFPGEKEQKREVREKGTRDEEGESFVRVDVLDEHVEHATDEDAEEDDEHEEQDEGVVGRRFFVELWRKDEI